MGSKVLLAGVCLSCFWLGGCAQQDPVRVENPDAGGPIVNPLAPGARQAGKSGVAAGQEYTAAPGMKTGIPK